MSSQRTAQYPNGEAEGVIIPGCNKYEFAFFDWSSNNQPLTIPTVLNRSIMHSIIGAEQSATLIPNSVTYGCWCI